MKSRLSLITAIAALGVWSMMSIGFASAAPVCYTPTWTVDQTGLVNVTANCTPDSGTTINSSTGYAWQKDGAPFTGTGSTSIQITDTLNDLNTHTYSVTATESNQTLSNSSAVTVLASLPSPCSLTITSGGTITNGGTATSITQGTPVTLSPACTGSSNPLEWYANSASNPIADPPGGVVTPAGTTNYFVVGSNGYGISASNQVSVTVTGPVTPAPVCNPISPSNPSVTVGSSQALSVSCTNTPNSYVWKVGSTTLSCTGSSCTVPAGNLPSAGPYTVSVTASNAGGPSSPVSTTVTVTSTSVAGCTIVPVTWANSVQIGVTPVQTMRTGQQFAFQVTYTSQGISSAGLLYTTPSTVGKFESISTSPCAFVNSPTTPVGANCSSGSRNNNPQIFYSTTPNTANACQLQTGTTYYINVRNSKTATGPDECPSGTACTYYLFY